MGSVVSERSERDSLSAVATHDVFGDFVSVIVFVCQQSPESENRVHWNW